MNILIIFSEAMSLPLENENVETFGLVLNKDRWEKTPYKDVFLDYVRTIDLMYKYGFKSNGGMEFVKNGEMFVDYGDITWGAFKTVVKICGVQYAVVGEYTALDEEDYQGEYFTNKEKWASVAKRAGLVWQR